VDSHSSHRMKRNADSGGCPTTRTRWQPHFGH
jgi:hypothetical protein